MSTRRTFYKEFRAEAVALVKLQGLSINKVANDLPVKWSQVDRWVKHDGTRDLKNVAAFYAKESVRGLTSSLQRGPIFHST